MKKYDNTRIKSENHLVLAYQAILSSGADNSVNFQLIGTNLVSIFRFEILLSNKLLFGDLPCSLAKICLFKLVNFFGTTGRYNFSPFNKVKFVELPDFRDELLFSKLVKIFGTLPYL